MSSKNEDNPINLDTMMGRSGYSDSKKGKLDHLVGNTLGTVMLAVHNNLDLDRETAKQNFLNGLEVAKNFPDYGMITEVILEEIIITSCFKGKRERYGE